MSKQLLSGTYKAHLELAFARCLKVKLPISQGNEDGNEAFELYALAEQDVIKHMADIFDEYLGLKGTLEAEPVI